jgi:hypothetical protein
MGEVERWLSRGDFMDTEMMALMKLKEAYKLLSQRFEDEGGRGVELADAIDFTASAIRSLGGEPDDN